MKLVIVYLVFDPKVSLSFLKELFPDSKCALVVNCEAYRVHYKSYHAAFDAVYPIKLGSAVQAGSKDGGTSDSSSLYQLILGLTELVIRRSGINLMSEVRLLTDHELLFNSLAKVREKLGIPDEKLEQILRFIDKLAMKKHLLNSQLRLPRFVQHDVDRCRLAREAYLKQVETTLGEYPYFVKPTNAAASMNTALLESHKDLCAWVNTIETSHYEIDEYVDGDVYVCDALLIDNKVKLVFVGKYMLPPEKYQRGQPQGIIYLPSDHPDYAPIYDFALSVYEAMKPVPNGFTHLELIKKRSTGELVFLEMAARISGGLAKFAYEKQFGINAVRAHFAARLGCKSNHALGLQDNYTRQFFSAFILYPKVSGKVVKVSSIDTSSQFELNVFIHEGENIKKAHWSQHNTAISVLLWNKDFQPLYEDFLALKDHEPYLLEQADIVSSQTSTSSFALIGELEKLLINVLLSTSLGRRYICNKLIDWKLLNR